MTVIGAVWFAAACSLVALVVIVAAVELGRYLATRQTPSSPTPAAGVSVGAGVARTDPGSAGQTNPK